ncbi:MAG TPA: S53 family peptidase [Candidatus Baltobacteraceae bacterium]
MRFAITAALSVAVLTACGSPGPTTTPSVRALAATANAPVRSFAASALNGAYVAAVGPATRVDLLVQLNGQHLDEIDNLISEQNTPGSPLYHHYLTPQQYGAYYGASAQDYAQATATLQSQGLTIDEAMPNRRDLFVHGSASAVESLIASPLDVRMENGRQFYTNRYAEQLPAALHAYAVSGDTDYHQVHSFSVHDPQVKIASGAGFGAHDIESVYDLTPIYSSATGTGVTISDATEGLASASDFATFQSKFGLNATLFSLASGSKSPPDTNGETTIDVEYMAAVAPKVSIDQVTASSTSDSAFNKLYSYIVNKLSAVHIVSTSWGDCEASYGSSFNIDESDFQQASAEGQWWFAAAGDSGVDDCENGTKGVDFPGSSPYVVSVGGTSVTPASSSGGNFTGWSKEVVWDDTLGCSSVKSCTASPGAGGGGVSTRFPMPSFQKALAHGNMREVPDVALIASPCDAPSGDSLCDSGANGGYFQYFQGAWQNGWGGTSFAAPEWSAFLALVAQKDGTTPITSPLTRLYALAGSPSYRNYFHDVTSGCNTYDGVSGFCASSSYDTASGLGSFIGAPLEAAY